MYIHYLPGASSAVKIWKHLKSLQKEVLANDWTATLWILEVLDRGWGGKKYQNLQVLHSIKIKSTLSVNRNI